MTILNLLKGIVYVAAGRFKINISVKFEPKNLAGSEKSFIEGFFVTFNLV